MARSFKKTILSFLENLSSKCKYVFMIVMGYWPNWVVNRETIVVTKSSVRHARERETFKLLRDQAKEWCRQMNLIHIYKYCACGQHTSPARCSTRPPIGSKFNCLDLKEGYWRNTLWLWLAASLQTLLLPEKGSCRVQDSCRTILARFSSQLPAGTQPQC